MARHGTAALRRTNGRRVRLGPVALAAALVGATVPVVANAASLGVTSQRLTTYSAPADPPGCASPGSQTLTTPSADSWIDESDPTKNNGTDSNLYVQSKTPNLNQRTLVSFALPALPTGCSVTSATLELYAKSSEGTRTIEAYRAASSWSESTVTWNTRPATTGAPATSASGTGWRSWSVTTLVQSMYTTANHGFVLKDQTEGVGSFRQNYASREDAPNDPRLVLTWD
jgi:hypothetical protein